jgi:hypothetical protein
MRLIPTQYVKPYVKTNKSDYIDAEAIAEAVIEGSRISVPLFLPRRGSEVKGTGIVPTFQACSVCQDFRCCCPGKCRNSHDIGIEPLIICRFSRDRNVDIRVGQF